VIYDEGALKNTGRESSVVYTQMSNN